MEDTLTVNSMLPSAVQKKLALPVTEEDVNVLDICQQSKQETLCLNWPSTLAGGEAEILVI